jgi:hypothetical protein
MFMDIISVLTHHGPRIGCLYMFAFIVTGNVQVIDQWMFLANRLFVMGSWTDILIE